ncbi:hypothetical protein ES707_12216 [subsurface metagenome]
MSVTQLFSRNAVIKIDETTPTTIGYIKNVRINIAHTKVKEYDDAGDVDVLEYGDQTITFSAEKGYLDKTLADLVELKTKLIIEALPQGSESTDELWTLAGCICDYEISWARNAVVLSRISGEAASLAITTVGE